MFLKIVIALFSVGVPLLIAEMLRNYTQVHREITRKVAHIGTAIGISVAPFYLSWEVVRVLAIALLIIVVLALYFKWGHGMYSVRRKTNGEILFPIAVIGVSLLASSPAIFCAAILHLGLADGFAAITGTLWGKKHTYRVLGDKKSYVGTITCFLVSLLILIGFNIWSNDPVSWNIILLLPFLATFFENIGVRGTDNVTVPMVVVVALSSL